MIQQLSYYLVLLFCEIGIGFALPLKRKELTYYYFGYGSNGDSLQNK